jgi:sugar lactone lactonase YvrE
MTLDQNGNLYTTDVRDSHIRKLNSGAEVFFFAGTGDQGFADGDTDNAKFGEESRVVADERGDVFVADAQNNRIREISVSGTVSTLAGSGVEGFRDGSGKDAQFNFPDGITMDKQGNLYISDGGNYCIRKINSAGQVSVFAGIGGRAGSVDGNRETGFLNIRQISQ